MDHKKIVRACWPIKTDGPAGLALRLAGLGFMLMLMASACTGVGHMSPQDPGYAEAKSVWDRYIQRTSQESGPAQAFWVKGNLEYTASGRTSRVVAELWGDIDLPARLNVNSPMGTALLLCREDRAEFLAFAPDREEAWSFADARQGLTSLGMASAFSLPVLARMAFGQVDAPLNFTSTKAISGRGFEYFFSGSGRVASMILDTQGRPLRISGKSGDSFEVNFSDYEQVDGREVPSKIVFEGRKSRAEIVVKGREFRPAKWPARSLTLEIPEGVGLKNMR